jgi:signal transduction histidine kinase
LRDLHDLVLQDLVSALQAAEAHRLARRGDVREAARQVSEMIYSLRRASRGVREAVHELRAGEVVGRALARGGGPRGGGAPTLPAGRGGARSLGGGIPRELPKEVCRDVLLVVREALANARRHSSARRVLVVLDAPKEELRVEVIDDRVGFDPNQSPEGVGLAAMRERSAALGGELKVSSEPGKGTTVRLRFPLPS